jgi:hypothetical protein
VRATLTRGCNSVRHRPSRLTSRPGRHRGVPARVQRRRSRWVRRRTVVLSVGVVASTAAAASLQLADDRPFSPVSPATQQSEGTVEPTSPHFSPVGSRRSLRAKAGASPSATAASEPGPSTAPGVDETGTAHHADEPAKETAVAPDPSAPTSSDEPNSSPSESPPATNDEHGDQHDEEVEDDPGLLPVLPAPGSQNDG